MIGTYQVLTINGKQPYPITGRGNANEIRLLETGVSASLGCQTIAVEGRLTNGTFVPANSSDGALVTGSGTCGLAPDKWYEPKLKDALLAGTVTIRSTDNKIILNAPGMEIAARIMD